MHIKVRFLLLKIFKNHLNMWIRRASV